MVGKQLGIGLALKGSRLLIIFLLGIATDILVIHEVGRCYYI